MKNNNLQDPYQSPDESFWDFHVSRPELDYTLPKDIREMVEALRKLPE